jgi:hypothetical protein
MDKLLKNPLVVGGALIGAYYILKKKPESKVGRTIGRVRDLTEDVVKTTLDTSTELISDVYGAGQDIFSIYDNEEVPDIDAGGMDGADSTLNVQEDAEDTEADPQGESSDTGSGMAEDTEDTNVDGSGFDGGTSRMTRGFDGATMDYNMDF